MYLSLHSYSQMWLIPWGYTRSKPSDYSDLVNVAKRGINAIAKVHGTHYKLGPVADLMYPTSGTILHFNTRVQLVNLLSAAKITKWCSRKNQMLECWVRKRWETRDESVSAFRSVRRLGQRRRWNQVRLHGGITRSRNLRVPVASVADRANRAWDLGGNPCNRPLSHMQHMKSIWTLDPHIWRVDICSAIIVSGPFPWGTAISASTSECDRYRGIRRNKWAYC